MILAKYREIFRNVTHRQFSFANEYGEALGSDAQVYRKCLDILNDEHAWAVDLLSCMCMLDRRGIPGFLFSQGDNKSRDFKSAVRTLIDLSLVTEKEENFFEMHYLVQLGTKRWLETYGDFQRRAAEVLALLSNQFPTRRSANWETYEVLEPHIQALLPNEFSSSRHCRLQRANILHHSAWYASAKGCFVIGENRAQQAVSIKMELLGTDHEDFLASLRLLAWTYRCQGRWKEAEELDSQVPTPRKMVPEGPDLQVIIVNPTSIYWKQGQSREAKELWVQVMTPSSRVPGEGHLWKVVSMANLLSIYRCQLRWEEAKEVAMQVMEPGVKVLGDERPDALTGMIDLISIYASHGQRKEEITLKIEMRKAREKLRRSKALHKALLMVSPSFRGQVWSIRAEDLGVRVMKTILLRLGEEHLATMTNMINLTLIYKNRSKWKELEELELQIVETSKRVEHLYTLISSGDPIWKLSYIRAWEELRMRIQKAREMFLEARTLKPQADVGTMDTKSTLIEADKTKPDVNITEPTTTRVEANRLMPQISPDSVEDDLEIPDGSPWAESIPIPSRTSLLDAIGLQEQEKCPSESFDEKRNNVHLRTGFDSDDEGSLRKVSIPSRRSLVDATTLKKPEKSTQDLSKSYDDRKRNVHFHKVFTSNDEGSLRKVSISSRGSLVDATTLKKPEKSTQDLSKSYDDRKRNVHFHKDFASNDEDFLREGSRSSSIDTTPLKRPEVYTQPSSKSFDEKRRRSHLRTGSSSDYEDPFRHESVSSIVDAKNMKEHKKLKNYSPKPFAEKTGSFHESKNLQENSSAEDVESVVSNKENKDRMNSKTTVDRATQGMIAEGHVGLLLAHHSDLRPLYEEALRRMDKNRFIGNVRRLLKQYYLDLSQYAETNLDRATSHLLRSRVSRIRIARHIADRFNPEYDEIRAQIEQHMRETGSKVPDLDAWITGNADPKPQNKAPKSEALSDIPTSDDDVFDDEEVVDDYKDRSTLPNTAEMEEFLIRGCPFQNLSMNLEILLLPATLGSLTRLLMSVPNDRIWFSAEDDLSLSNKMKTFMEDHTEENWNWWPLQPRMRVLQNNQTRLHWRCHCDMHLWTELSILDAKNYQSFLKRRKKVYQHNHLCGTRKRKASLTNSLAGILQAAGSAFHPGRWYGSSRSSSATSPHATERRSVIEGSWAKNTLSPLQRTASSNQQAAQISINMPQKNEAFVLFGVKGTRRTLELAQINARKYVNDSAFFWDMRKQYRELRGFLRYWFSIWRFSHCDFVKFEKIRANRIIPRGKEIPTDMNYEYKPRHPHAEDPPISPHEFELAFASCGTSCMFSSFHDCIEAPNGDFAMERIPKRKSALQLETGMMEFAWGIQAQHAISLVNLIVYHFLILAGTFGFWAWWQIRHPNDIQNAATPLATVAVLLSIFWSSAGLLKIFRQTS